MKYVPSWYFFARCFFGWILQVVKSVLGACEHFRPEPRILTRIDGNCFFQDAVTSIPSLYTGGGSYQPPPTVNMADADLDTKLYSLSMQLLSTHSWCYGFVYIGTACMLLLNTLNYMSRLLLLDGGKGNDGLMVIYNSQKHRMMVIAPEVWKMTSCHLER